VPDYFLSDVHLRLDEPDRGRRLAALVDRFGPGDSLTIVGDLCDFWYASRQIDGDPMACAGLRALAAFRDRGGPITVLAGNHDAWLGPFYERAIGARFLPDALDLQLQGLRIHVVHGHRQGARTPWKAWMEGRAFLAAFRRLPAPLADLLGERLRRTNERHQEAFEDRGLEVLRRFAGGRAGCSDLVVVGHVHRPLDTGPTRPRLVVLGGWREHSCYLALEDGVASHFVEPA